MKTIDPTKRPEEELAAVVSGCRFIPRYGTRQFSDRFAIEISGRNPLRNAFGNLTLRIVPLIPTTATDPELLKEAKQAHEELVDHLAPGIAQRARWELERLNSEPLPAALLAHRPIVLDQSDAVRQELTDEHGDARFTGVELDKECSLQLGDSFADPEDELTGLVSHLRFSDRNGTVLNGCFWQVTVQVGQNAPQGEGFEAAVAIRALDPKAEGLLPCRVVLLRMDDGPSPMWVLSPGPTNAQGEVRFPMLPPGIYEAFLAETAANLRANPADQPALAHCASAVARFAQADADAFAPLRVRLPDRPVEVVLSQGADGLAVLTFETSDPALAGTGHTWVLGGESGWFELEPAGDRWSAVSRLAMDAAEARSLIHRLVVMPEMEAETATRRDDVVHGVFKVSQLDREAFDSLFQLALAAAPADIPVAHEEERRFSHEEPGSGPVIEALLQPTAGGGTCLTLRSEDRALAGAGVAYKIGTESGTVRFGARKAECFYRATVALRIPWSEAREASVAFEIFPKPA